MTLNINQINSQWSQYQSHLDMNMKTSNEYVIIIRIRYQQWCILSSTVMLAGLIATDCHKRSTGISQQWQQPTEYQFGC